MTKHDGIIEHDYCISKAYKEFELHAACCEMSPKIQT